MKQLFLSALVLTILSLLACGDSSSDSSKVSYCLVSTAEGNSIVCTQLTGYIYTQEGCNDDASNFGGGAIGTIATECPEGNVLATCEDSQEDSGLTWTVYAYHADGVEFCMDY